MSDHINIEQMIHEGGGASQSYTKTIKIDDKTKVAVYRSKKAHPPGQLKMATYGAIKKLLGQNQVQILSDLTLEIPFLTFVIYSTKPEHKLGNVIIKSEDLFDNTYSVELEDIDTENGTKLLDLTKSTVSELSSDDTGTIHLQPNSEDIYAHIKNGTEVEFCLVDIKYCQLSKNK